MPKCQSRFMLVIGPIQYSRPTLREPLIQLYRLSQKGFSNLLLVHDITLTINMDNFCLKHFLILVD